MAKEIKPKRPDESIWQFRRRVLLNSIGLETNNPMIIQRPDGTFKHLKPLNKR